MMYSAVYTIALPPPPPKGCIRRGRRGGVNRGGGFAGTPSSKGPPMVPYEGGRKKG